jgi:transketolase
LKLYGAGMTTLSNPRTTHHNTPEYGYDDLPGLMSLLTGDEKHSPSATSTLDVLWTLYDRVLNVSPQTVDSPRRDRFLMSKGHGPMAYYAVLAAKGFIPVDLLPTFGDYDSPLGMHPDATLIPGVEIASGSLGHGLPLAVGVSLALEVADTLEPRVVCLLGDGEFDEGSNHEAIALGGRLGLHRLTAVVIDNNSSRYGWPSSIAGRFEVEGWTAATVDGRDHDALAAALSARDTSGPNAVIAVVEPRR